MPEIPSSVPWTTKLAWAERLVIDGKTYKPTSLFKVSPTKNCSGRNMAEDEYVDSPNGKWRYSEIILPRGRHLDTWRGSRFGSVAFTTDVIIPRIHEVHKSGGLTLWMSFTPAELFSMRTGARKAKGTTIIAGLGMGCLLRMVLDKKSVKKVILVEQDQDIVDWILPVIMNGDGEKVEVVIIGDAHKVLPTIEGDIALIDIDEGYGNNTFREDCPFEKWIWGSATIVNSGRNGW